MCTVGGQEVELATCPLLVRGPNHQYTSKPQHDTSWLVSGKLNALDMVKITLHVPHL